MSKKQIVAIILTGFLILLGGIWFYYSWVSTVNYLIPGVSYNGVYNLYLYDRSFYRADSSEISSILDIIGYWGDKRFTIPNLKTKFSTTVASTSSLSSPGALKLEIQNFFTENGYETSGWLSVEPANVIKEIEQFVNSKKKVPIIALSRRILDEKNGVFIYTAQVVIGIFDNSRKVIVHDHNYGNNYEISYDDFTNMFQGAGSGILAVWPSDKIKESIEGPNYNLVYSQRLESMDKAGTLLATKRFLATEFWRTRTFRQSITVRKELFNDPNFKYLPPAFQIVLLTGFAKSYINLDQPEEAIKIINEQVLPLNKNLSQTSQGWAVPVLDESFYPYYVLSLAYLKEEKRDLAMSSYKKMKLISASASEKLSEDYSFSPPLIEELEK